MKLLIMPKSINQTKDLISNCDGVIVGLDKLCINMPNNFTKDELKQIIDICKYNKKEVFISLNKNMHNSDLDYLKEVLIEFDNYNVEGFIYYDIALVNLKEELNLKTSLVWHQEHLTTNYLTSNYWYDHGALYTYLSSEITKEEINEISTLCKAKTLVNIFGYLPMFVSRRHLVKNYLKTFNISDNSKINYIKKEGKTYQIIDSCDGTIAYSSAVLNGIEEILSLKCDYAVLNCFEIEEEFMKEILEMYKNVNESNVLEYKERIDSKLNTDLGFLYKETIYKVK